MFSSHRLIGCLTGLGLMAVSGFGQWTADANGYYTNSKIGIGMGSGSSAQLSVLNSFNMKKSGYDMLYVRNVGNGGNMMTLYTPGSSGTEAMYFQAGNYGGGWDCKFGLKNSAGSTNVYLHGNNACYIKSGLAINVTSNVVNGVTYPLAVKGKICAQELVVSSTGWADYVLKKDYQLLDLDEVERHISEKGTLPGIPSAKEVEVKGVSVGEMQEKLLAKIEELTLYVIKQQKEIEQLKSAINKTTSLANE